MTNEHNYYCGERGVISVGSTLPDFILEAFQKETIKTIKHSSFKGKWLVLFFYPADFTFICPTELDELVALYPEFKKLNAEVLSISTDKVHTHKAWHDQSPTIRNILFPMVADPAGKLSQSLGVYNKAEGSARRASFIISPHRIIKALEVHDDSIGRSGAELLRKLAAAKFAEEHTGEVCPANWSPGAKTLKPGLNLVGKL
jgi:NADH-dependent peroxiredoxin subunit C